MSNLLCLQNWGMNTCTSTSTAILFPLLLADKASFVVTDSKIEQDHFTSKQIPSRLFQHCQASAQRIIPAVCPARAPFQHITRPLAAAIAAPMLTLYKARRPGHETEKGQKKLDILPSIDVEANFDKSKEIGQKGA